MTRSFFITGTDTDVGKTHVAAELIKGFRERGFQVSGFKPVAAGAEWLDGEWKNQDALDLMNEASVRYQYNEVNPYCFEPAMAPHIAAKQVSVEMEFSVVESVYTRHEVRSDVVIIEGAGGWKVPFNNQTGFDDLVVAMNVPVVLVVGLKLGCINHALLTEEAILNKGCRLVGWVGNDVDGDFQDISENIETLKDRMQSPYIGCFEYQVNKGKKSEYGQRNIESLLDYLTDFR
jgi:dethiobiotin synthetase